MKDITVALELTVPKDMPDDKVREFVEKACRNAISEDWIPEDADGLTYDIVPNLIDVVAIREGTFDFERGDWRRLPSSHP